MARRAHNPEVVGSNPAPATNAPVAQSVEQWIEDPCVVGSIPTGGTMNRRQLTLCEFFCIQKLSEKILRRIVFGF